MVKRKDVLTEYEPELVKLVAEESGIVRNRLEIGLAQARSRDLADGDGADAIRSAFATSRARRNNQQDHP